MTQNNSSPGFSPGPSLRTLDRDGRFTTILIGDKSRLGDVYHFLMIAPWSLLLVLVVCAYILINVLFAAFFLLGGDCIANAHPGSFLDAFFFSVQTMATIGYGSMAPSTVYAHVLVTIEALFGLCSLALATGLMFAKFSRPTARVIFSNVALLQNRHNKPHIVFRVANVRSNQIVEATIQFVALKWDIAPEGDRLRRFHDLSLLRTKNPVFAMTWTVMHPLDETSPLYGMSLQQMRETRTELIAILVGIDGTSSQTIHARHAYTADEIIENARFVDIILDGPKGKRVLDLRLFHNYTRLGE